MNGQSDLYAGPDYSGRRKELFENVACTGATSDVLKVFNPGFGEPWKLVDAEGLCRAVAGATSGVGLDLLAYSSPGATGVTVGQFDGGTSQFTGAAYGVIDPEEAITETEFEADGYLLVKNRNTDASLKMDLNLIYQLLFDPSATGSTASTASITYTT